MPPPPPGRIRVSWKLWLGDDGGRAELVDRVDYGAVHLKLVCPCYRRLVYGVSGYLPDDIAQEPTVVGFGARVETVLVHGRAEPPIALRLEHEALRSELVEDRGAHRNRALHVGERVAQEVIATFRGTAGIL